MSIYGDDLAYIHDVGFGDFSERAAPAVLETMRARGIDAGLVVDLGCGSGRWARKLVDAGYDVLGIDSSAAMLELARRRVREAELRQASIYEGSLPRCVTVTSLGECFSYGVADRLSDGSLESTFGHVWRALAPGGLFVFDVAEPGIVSGSRRRRSWRQGDDWAIFVAAEEDAESASLTRRLTAFREVEGTYRRSEETHRLRLYRASKIAELLRGRGFRVRVVRGYGELRFRRSHVGFVASKPRRGRHPRVPTENEES